MSRVNDYDGFAAAYSVESDTEIQNAYLHDRPAILALAGDVAGEFSMLAAGPIPCSRNCATEGRS